MNIFSKNYLILVFLCVDSLFSYAIRNKFNQSIMIKFSSMITCCRVNCLPPNKPFKVYVGQKSDAVTTAMRFKFQQVSMET